MDIRIGPAMSRTADRLLWYVQWILFAHLISGLSWRVQCAAVRQVELSGATVQCNSRNRDPCAAFPDLCSEGGGLCVIKGPCEYQCVCPPDGRIARDCASSPDFATGHIGEAGGGGKEGTSLVNSLLVFPQDLFWDMNHAGMPGKLVKSTTTPSPLPSPFPSSSTTGSDNNPPTSGDIIQASTTTTITTPTSTTTTTPSTTTTIPPTTTASVPEISTAKPTTTTFSPPASPSAPIHTTDWTSTSTTSSTTVQDSLADRIFGTNTATSQTGNTDAPFTSQTVLVGDKGSIAKVNPSDSSQSVFPGDGSASLTDGNSQPGQNVPLTAGTSAHSTPQTEITAGSTDTGVAADGTSDLPTAQVDQGMPNVDLSTASPSGDIREVIENMKNSLEAMNLGNSPPAGSGQVQGSGRQDPSLSQSGDQGKTTSPSESSLSQADTQSLHIPPVNPVPETPTETGHPAPAHPAPETTSTPPLVLQDSPRPPVRSSEPLTNHETFPTIFSQNVPDTDQSSDTGMKNVPLTMMIHRVFHPVDLFQSFPKRTPDQ